VTKNNIYGFIMMKLFERRLSGDCSADR